MGNSNNCIANPLEYEEIKLRPEKNISKNKSFNYHNSKNIPSSYFLFHNPKLDIINEEDIQEQKSNFEKQPKDSSLRSSLIKKNDNSLVISTPKDIKII